MSNIVLIGFMGCGKSSIGRALAHKKGLYFLDTDALIETCENRNIKDIFAKNGEAYFRALEQKCFDWMDKSVQNSVISTGGGMPGVIESFSSLGICIYLDVTFETLTTRLNMVERNKRPLFADTNRAKELFESRQPLYRQKADIILDANNPFEMVLETITNLS